MGGSVGGGSRKGGRGRRGVPRYGAMADINMTPFIDVMLVLLIIFMVAAPLLTNGVTVDLPKSSAGALNIEQKPVSISIDEKGQIFVMDQPVADADVIGRLQSLAKDGTDYAHLPARLQGRALRAGRRDHGRDHHGGLQEGRAGHRSRFQVKRGVFRRWKRDRKGRD